MVNKKQDTSRIVLGAAIGGLIGGCVLYLLRTHERPILSKVRRTLANVSDVLDESQVNDPKQAIDDIEEALPQGENLVSDALNLIATGVNLWNHFKKRK